MLNNYRIFIVLTAALMVGAWSAPLAACSVDDEYRIAAGYYARSQWRESIRAFEALIRNHPETQQSYSALFYLGEAQTQISDYPRAFAAFDQLIKSWEADQDRPTDSTKKAFTEKHRERAYFRRAECAFFSRDYKATAKLIQDFQTNYGSSSYKEFSLTYLGRSLMESQQFQKAIPAFREQISSFPESSQLTKNRIDLAKCYQKLEKHDQAAMVLETVAKGPGASAPNAAMAVGHMWFRAGQYQKARSAYESFLARFPNHISSEEIRYWLGRSLMALKQWENAATQLTRVSEDKVFEPLASQIVYDAAVCFIKIERFQKAEDLLKRLLDQWPNSQWADDSLQLRVDIASHENDHERVLQLGREFQRRFVTPAQFSESSAGLNESNRVTAGRVKQQMGRSHYETKNYSQSEKCFAELLEDYDETRTPQSLRSNRPNWQYLRAASQIGLKQYESAKNELERIRDDVNPRFDASVLLARATVDVGLKRYSDAAERYESFLKKFPHSSMRLRVQSDLCIVYCKLNQIANAHRVFQRLKQSEKGPFVIPAAQSLAELAYEAETFGIATECYTLLVERGFDPKHKVQGISGLFWIANAKNDSQKAVKYSEALIEAYPGHSETSACVFAAASELIKQSEFAAAQRLLEGVLESGCHPKSISQCTILYTSALRKQNRRELTDKAKAVLEEFITAHPNDSLCDAATYELGWISIETDQKPAAIEHFNTLVERFPNSRFCDDAFLRIAVLEFEMEHWAEAAKAARLLIESRPENQALVDHAYLLRGRSLLALKKFSEAQHALTTCLRRTKEEPQRLSAAHWIGESIVSSNNIVDSFGQFQAAQKGFNPQAAKWIPSVNLRVAQKLSELEQFSLAKKIALETQDRFKDFEFQYELDYVIGRALASEAEFKSARERYQRTIASENGASTETAAKAQWMIGESFFHQERYAEAIEAYYRVDSLFGYTQWRAAALFQAAKCQEKLQNMTAARKLYNQVIKLLPQSDFAAQARTRLNRLTEIVNKKRRTLR